MTPEEIATLGYDCYMRSYKGKMYPEMKALISNLKEYGFEVWILTASPEFLYQRFVASELGIPVTHVLGVKGVVKSLCPYRKTMARLRLYLLILKPCL